MAACSPALGVPARLPRGRLMTIGQRQSGTAHEQASPFPFQGDRPDAGARRPDLRAPARRLGRRLSSRSRNLEDEGFGGERHGSDFQNLHRNKRSIAIDLKKPEGVAILKTLVAERRCPGRELPARCEIPPRHRLRDAESRQQATRLCQHLGLRPGRALSRPAGLRSDRAGHGRADGDHRRTRAKGRCALESPWPISAPGSSPHKASSSRCSSARNRARASGCIPRC